MAPPLMLGDSGAAFAISMYAPVSTVPSMPAARGRLSACPAKVATQPSKPAQTEGNIAGIVSAAAAAGIGAAAADGVRARRRRGLRHGRKRGGTAGTAVPPMTVARAVAEDVEAPPETEDAEAPPETEDTQTTPEKSFYNVAASNAKMQWGAMPAPIGRELEETAQDRVFDWLGRSPKPASPCFKTLQKFFPGALPTLGVHMRTKTVLEEQFGFTPANTLLGSSFCPDEINNNETALATKMRRHWGKIFPMGGISGAPFVGETGFKAFSSHVAEDGNIIVVFGPHVGVSEGGEVGKYLRPGQSGLSSACGAVIGAYSACLSGDVTGEAEMDPNDMQMSEIIQEFAPHAETISKTENPMASCAYQAYEFVKDRMLKIVNTDFGSGKLVLIGGIQINLPQDGQVDHFLPLMFEVRQAGQPTQDLMHFFSDPSTQQDLNRAPWAAVAAQREVFAWLSWSPPAVSPVYQALHKYFPGALPGQAVHQRSLQILKKYGFTPQNTLLGTSVCSDEINNEPTDLPVLMQDYWGDVFPMGGISGVPFSGKTGFKAFSSHVAQDGHIIVVFGPHVAISDSGEVGQCLRKGQQGESTACGAVIGAYKACLSSDFSPEGSSSYDLQMDYIKQAIAPHAFAITRSENPMASLSHQSYQMVRDQIFTVVNNDFGSGYLCLIGGIQINLPYPMEDHFYPCTFELRREGEPTLDLLWELKEFR